MRSKRQHMQHETQDSLLNEAVMTRRRWYDDFLQFFWYSDQVGSMSGGCGNTYGLCFTFPWIDGWTGWYDGFIWLIFAYVFDRIPLAWYHSCLFSSLSFWCPYVLNNWLLHVTVMVRLFWRRFWHYFDQTWSHVFILHVAYNCTARYSCTMHMGWATAVVQEVGSQ